MLLKLLYALLLIPICLYFGLILAVLLEILLLLIDSVHGRSTFYFARYRKKQPDPLKGRWT